MPRSASPSQRSERLNKTVRFYRLFLRIGTTVLAALFVKSIVSQLPQPTMGSLEAFILLKLSLAGYLYCWLFGCTRDLHVENDVLVDAPGPSAKHIAVALIVAVAFTFMFYVDNLSLLSGVFIAFLAANVGGWFFLTRVLRPLSREALKHYRESADRIGEIKVMIFEGYMFGRWQWFRFGMGFALLVFLALTTLRVFQPPFGLDRDMAFSILTFLTLLSLEGWIWYQRFRLKIQWEGLDWLHERGFIR